MIKNIYSESQLRMFEKLHRDLGEHINNSLVNECINEIMLNPDGSLWVDSSQEGQVYLADLSSSQVFSIINDVAGIHNFVATQRNPLLEAEFPAYKSMKNERFTAQVPPIVANPCFTIRKKSIAVFTLDQYVNTNRVSKTQAHLINSLIEKKKNILVCGGPGSGKTTITNALIIEAVKYDPSQRFLILEDLPELQCEAPNKVAFISSNEVDMTKLLRAAMRMRPDRILIGEVRGKEALDMLKAWNTGASGGICTIHANGAEEAMQRVIDLTLESGILVAPIQLILHTINAVISVERRGHQKGYIQEILSIEGYENDKFIYKYLG